MMKGFQLFVDFVRDVYDTPEAFIPLHEPRFRGNEKKYLNECIDSTFVSSVGKFVDKFEQMVAEYTGAKYAIAAVNGTAALHMALILLGVKSGDEVITQPLTFIATANAINYCGAKPVFIDVDRDTMGLSPKALREWLEENIEMRNVKAKVEVKDSSSQPKPQSYYEAYNKNTGNRISACVPMHTFGHPCRIGEIITICEEYHIEVIEDAAESLGSFYSSCEISDKKSRAISRGKGKHTGTFGKLGTLSFNGNKTITTGGGGMIITNDEKLAKLAKHLTTQAKVPHKWDYVHDFIGYNYRLTNLAAALGVAQMEQLPEIIKSKRELAQTYAAFFSTIYPESNEGADPPSHPELNGELVELVEGSASAFSFFTEPPYAKSNYWLNAIILKNREQRDEFLEYTNKKGVMTRPIWELMNRLPMFKDCQKGDLSNAEWLVDRVVNIPSTII